MKWLPGMLLTLLIFSGCKKESSPPADQPTSLEAITDAQNKALKNIQPIQIKTGEFVYILKTQELYSSQEPIENLVEETGTTITEREEYGSFFDITVIKETIDHIPKDKPHYKFKNVYSIDYPIPLTPTSFSKASMPRWLQPWSDKLNPLSTQDSTETKIEFYNLRVVNEKISPPKKVLEHSPCAQDTDCRIDVTKLFYTVVFTPPNEAPQRNEFELWISTDVPYFATILKSCVTGLIKVDTAYPAIRQCESVYDYSFEALPSP